MNTSIIRGWSTLLLMFACVLPNRQLSWIRTIFYGEFLYEQKDYANAQQYLQTALHTPARPGAK
jgi:hypothetical protein